jgi:hypothetical protein
MPKHRKVNGSGQFDPVSESLSPVLLKIANKLSNLEVEIANTKSQLPDRLARDMLDRCPFAWNCHEVSFHSNGETCLVKWRLDDSRRLTTDHHGKTLADTFHLLQNIVLSHEINHSDNQFHGFLVNTNENGIIKDVNDGEEQSILDFR